MELKRLILKSDTLSVEVLPELGGKIASIRKDGHELLQKLLAPYTPRTITMGFDESDASGFDECLPSVSACDIETPAGKIAIPDHGEFWRLPSDVEQLGPRKARLTATGSVLPLRLERTLDVNGDSLSIGYQVKNVGDTETHYAWSAHPLFAVDAGDRIVLPPSVSEVQVEGSARDRLGPRGSIHSWPITKLPSGDTAELHQTEAESSEIGDKIYTQAPREGWCAVERRRIGLRVQVEFDPTLSPYLGLWLCYGGWPEGHKNRQNCVALEPCTAPVDSLALAIKRGWARVLAPGQSDHWRMRITVSVVS